VAQGHGAEERKPQYASASFRGFLWEERGGRSIGEGCPWALSEKDHVRKTPLHFADVMKVIKVVWISVEAWSEGKAALNNKGKTPLDLFRFAESRRAGKHQLSNEEERRLQYASSSSCLCFQDRGSRTIGEGWPWALREKDHIGDMPL
jgi:hypothetical protein